MFLGVRTDEENIRLSAEGKTKLKNVMELLKAASLEFVYVTEKIQGVAGINAAENIDFEIFQDYYKLEFLLDPKKRTMNRWMINCLFILSIAIWKFKSSFAISIATSYPIILRDVHCATTIIAIAVYVI
ncbi:hypothetical protein [Weissella diestrammenae]|nr:hypothetical protein [Weissella diestrammenae]MCM0582721.1 hypothetical protein [Weissella diestrammenae]